MSKKKKKPTFTVFDMLVKISVACFITLFVIINIISITETSKAQGLKDAFQTSDGTNDDNLDAAAEKAGFNTSQSVVDDPVNPLIVRIIQTGLTMLGLVFMILMIYGGFLWMSDQGNEQQVEKAKNIITSALIGIMIVLMSYAISWFVINAFSEKTLKPQLEGDDFSSIG